MNRLKETFLDFLGGKKSENLVYFCVKVHAGAKHQPSGSNEPDFSSL